MSHYQQRIRIALLLPLLLLCSGCPKVETTARDAIAGAKKTTDNLKVKYGCSGTPTTASACATIAKVVAAKDLTIDALEAYCGGPSFDNGGACNAPAKGTPAATQAAQKLQSALTGLQQTLADVKGL